MRPSEFRILAALTEAPNGLTYTELRLKVNLSNPVLSQCVANFKKLGIIIQTDINKVKHERSRYKLATTHQTMENQANTFEKRMQMVIRDAPTIGSEISMVKDVELRKKIYEDFLRFHINNISLLILRTMRNAVLHSLTNPSNLKNDADYNQRITKLSKKRAIGFAKEMASDWEKRMTEFNAEIQEEMLNWVVPYTQMLSLAYYSNCQFMPRAILEDELNKRFEKETLEKSFWSKKLEEIEDEFANKDPEYAKMTKEIRKLEKKRYKETSKP